jgi:hypothetical protein
MQAVTITQITPPELETLIENSIRKLLPFHSPKLTTEIDQWFNVSELFNYLSDKPTKATLAKDVFANTIPYPIVANHFTQLQIMYEYLKKNIATASMVSAATGVPQKCITRYKRKLEKAGLLWEIEENFCKKTGLKAWYLTTNPDLISISSQLKLFSCMGL